MKLKLARLFSLRGRLLMFLLVPLLVVLLVSVAQDYRNAMNPTNEVYDRALASTAVALAALVKNDQGQAVFDLAPSIEMALRTSPYEKINFAVLDTQGHLLGGDAALAVFANGGNGLANPEFRDEVMQGTSMRVVVYQAWASNLNIEVVVAEANLRRKQTASQIVAAVVWSNLLLITVTMLTVFFGVRLALSPLTGLGHIISQRRTSDLRPIPTEGVPTEAQPLIQAMNQLILNLQQSHNAQQAFLTAMAHQLRTPISGLQMQLELTQQSLPPEYQPRIEKLLEASRKLAHFIHQMLALARSSPDADLAHEFTQVDLAGLCDEAASEFINAALARNIDLGFETTSVMVTGSAWLLREMLANLMDNAIKYTRPGGRVTCRCGLGTDQRPFLEVEDDGPGIPEGIREKVFERFYRPAPNMQSGIGLGLNIVKEVAARHQAEVIIATPDSHQGVCFHILFPARA
jgi:two-component system sensor histidine kinase TctE